jgi:hypothetical protein
MPNMCASRLPIRKVIGEYVRHASQTISNATPRKYGATNTLVINGHCTTNQFHHQKTAEFRGMSHACSSSSTFSSSSTLSSSSTNALEQVKWDTLYALQERIVRFIASLERRNRLYPPPFHRRTIGGDAKIDGLRIQYSDTVSSVANKTVLGVFLNADDSGISSESGTEVCTSSSSSSTSSSSSNTYLSNYPGWLLTEDEYAELNNKDHENIGALYGFGLPLKAFMRKHWSEAWDPPWKEVDWVLMGDPVTTGANFNTLSGIKGKTYNCEFRVNHHPSLKLLTKDGRYSVVSDIVTIHTQSKVKRLASHAELFVPYDDVVKGKKRVHSDE